MWPWHFTDDLENQQVTSSKQHQALFIISSSYVNSNWSNGLETVKLGFDLCDLNLWPLTFCMDLTLVIGNNYWKISWWYDDGKITVPIPQAPISWNTEAWPSMVTHGSWPTCVFKVICKFCFKNRFVIWFKFKTLRPRQNGHFFPGKIFKFIFLIENGWIFIKISLKFVPINNILALIQVMAYRRLGNKPLSEPMPLVDWRIYASLGLNVLN